MLSVGREKRPTTGSTVVERAWVQTWLGGGVRQDRAAYRVTSSEEQIGITLPEGVALDDLSVLGPLFCLKLKSAPEGYNRRLVTELWFYPDGSRILELSTKCEPSEAFQVSAEARAFLSSKEIDLGSEQQTKTRTALEYFSKSFKNGAEKAATAGVKKAKSTAKEAADKAAAKDAEKQPAG
jgi:hypothetical protein